MSAACCSIPPVVSDTDSYERKGAFSASGDLKTYVTGSQSSKTGILLIYDIFGLLFNQTLQGADILASAGHLVVIPDFFKGAPVQLENYPPDTDVKKANLQAFFKGPADPVSNVKIVKELLPKLKEQYPEVEKWALVGLCWGGKIVSLLSGADSPFVAGVQCHPAFVDPKDAESFTIPHLCIATKDEDKDAIQGIKKAVEASKNDAVREKSKVERWEEKGTFHGFMAARSNLKDKDNLEYYKKGYQEIVNWLKTVL